MKTLTTLENEVLHRALIVQHRDLCKRIADLQLWAKKSPNNAVAYLATADGYNSDLETLWSLATKLNMRLPAV